MITEDILLSYLTDEAKAEIGEAVKNKILKSIEEADIQDDVKRMLDGLMNWIAEESDFDSVCDAVSEKLEKAIKDNMRVSFVGAEE